MPFLLDIRYVCSFLMAPSLLLLTVQEVFADVVSDQSLSTPSQVQRNNKGTFRITRGTVSGRYLFHSFQEFSLSPQQRARFVNPPQIKGIIARVTGGQTSRINGLIQSPTYADIFFLNPNGINFGSRAQLDVGGSFIASTAKTLIFNNNTRFLANTTNNAPPLLTISRPTGLKLGSQTPASIRLAGRGHGLIIDPDTSEVVPVNRPTELLQVQPNKTLGLIGGDVIIEGGNLQSSGGRIFINALGKNQSLTIISDRLGWKAIVPKNQTFRDIVLDNAASLITNGNGGGSIDLSGRFVEILGGSTLLATSFGTRSGQGINIFATEENIISGFLSNPLSQNPIFPSSVFSEVGIGQDSPGGPINIAGGLVEISEGAQISTSTFGFGNGNNISVNADKLIVSGGTDQFGPSGIYLDVFDEFTEGDGGDLRIRAQDLVVTQGGLISASTFGPGNSGLINIQANRVEVSGGAPGLGASAIFSQAENLGSTQKIKIISDRIDILQGGEISSDTFGFAAGGSIEIQTNTFNLDGSSPGGKPGGVFSIVRRPDFSLPDTFQQIPESKFQDAGVIDIRADKVVIEKGAEINSSTEYIGDAGNIEIQANDLSIDAQGNLSTGIFATSERDAQGVGGNLTVKAQNLNVLNGGQIAVATRSPEKSGTLIIQAGRVDLRGTNQNARSGLFASALESTGGGGNLEIISDNLTIRDGATINVGNFPSLLDRSPNLAGQGAAGSVLINASRIILDNEGSINASTATGDRGNLTIQSELLVLNNQSQISTDTTSSIGGNIIINTQQLFGLNDSDIQANASKGKGGQILIAADQIFGSQPRSQLTPLSDITASSELGTESGGTIEIRLLTPSPDRDQSLRQKDIIDTSRILTRSCFQSATSRQGRFLDKGAGGLATQPYSSTTSFFNSLNLDINQQSTQTSNTLPIEASEFITLPNNIVTLGRMCS